MLHNNSDIFLSSKPFPNIPESVFNEYWTKSFDISDWNNVKTSWSNTKWDLIPTETYKPSVGWFNPWSKLIEAAYSLKHSEKPQMMNKYSWWTDDIFKYRNIRGDGNCFYRAVMFSFFEQIILTGNHQFLKNILFHINDTFKNNHYASGFNIKTDWIQKIWILICVAIKKGKLEQAYELFMKSWSNCAQFDTGLIVYFRLIMIQYIKENEEKWYTQEFPVKVGNWLPSEYETEKGDFLFNKFYNEFLMKMGKDAEKIVIYLTPFVLCVKWEVVMFECENDFRKSFNYIGNTNNSSTFNIALLNKSQHYILIYTKEYYQMNIEIFKKYSLHNYTNQVLTEIKNDDIISQINILQWDETYTKSKPSDNILQFDNDVIQQVPKMNTCATAIAGDKCEKCNINKSVVLKLCSNCYLKEIKGYLSSLYFKIIKRISPYYKTNSNTFDYVNVFTQMLNNEKIQIIKSPNSPAMTPDYALQLWNDQIPQGKRLYLQNWINEMKLSYCLTCQTFISNNNKIILPCNCAFCSAKCWLEHYSTVNSLWYKKQSQNYGCICTGIYETHQIVALWYIFTQWRWDKLCNNTLNLWKVLTKNKCANCQSEVKVNHNYIKCKNSKSDVQWKNWKQDWTFTHAVCSKCYQEVQSSKTFLCSFCRCEHWIIEKTNSDSDTCIVS